MSDDESARSAAPSSLACCDKWARLGEAYGLIARFPLRATLHFMLGYAERSSLSGQNEALHLGCARPRTSRLFTVARQPRDEGGRFVLFVRHSYPAAMPAL